MVRQRVIGLTLTASLLASVAVGCSQTTSSNEGTSSQTPASNGGTSTQVPAAKEKTKLRVAVGTEGLQYVEGSQNINEDPYVKKLRELSGIDVQLELIPHKDFNQKLTLIFAGGDLPQLLQTRGINMPETAPAVDNGALYELNELLDKYGPNLKKNIPKEAWDYGGVSKNGKIYGIPTLNPTPNDVVNFVRKDWLDKLNLSVPKTVDEYINMLRAFRDKDPNGNGKQDEIPYSGREKLAWTEMFFGAYGVVPADWTLENGQLVPNTVRAPMKEALKVYRTLYSEKLLDNEVFVQQPKDWDAKIKAQGIVGLWHHVPRLADKWAGEVMTGTPTAKLDIIPAPTGPDGKGGLTIKSIVGQNVWVIPKSNKKPEDAIKFLDWFYSDAAQKFLLYGIEGVDHTVNGGQIKYNFPVKTEDIYREEMHLTWLRFVSPSHILNKEFMKDRPNGEMVSKGIEVASKEGRKNDALGMPVMPTLQARPELGRDGLWLEFAAKVITGKESVDNFDKFVEDWKKRGGDQLIKEATQWYNSVNKK
ncbi:extracellular solute-binding protein [Bacillus sp. 3255]|uniref:extracellular solute-binding protein n=1 Tax=Bacillus sp. 3255 TaxID=2817904 RepID=UPI002860C10D|nr:extracellular solute-binding protein [Bacillus sp. 3255]MDR6881274.1 putative aldouronate transport system substrate-binding protein [Bacillus sp. 3255]